jgi:hypothetical protein
MNCLSVVEFSTMLGFGFLLWIFRSLDIIIGNFAVVLMQENSTLKN